jgi:hypothetical protein
MDINMTVNYAETQCRCAYLSTDFGAQLACRKFNLSFDELAEKVGRYSRGKRKGQLRGSISWHKVVKGGWVKTGRYDHEESRAQGFVARVGVAFAFTLNGGNGETLAEEGVVWHHSRDGVKVDVWSSYRMTQLKRSFKPLEEEATVQVKAYILIRLADNTVRVGVQSFNHFNDANALIGTSHTITCIADDIEFTGLVFKVLPA